ncbi:RmlD substrate binding domain protein [uncultured archaeon]|nr:RmlD substrate binding domain protein [uncultured archaeon]
MGSKAAQIALAGGHEVFSGYAHSEPLFGQAVRFNLENNKSISDLMESLSPEIVIHSAALTDVDRCEREKDLAYRVNVEGTRALAQAAEKAGSFLIYISTDYIFDGSRGMYREDDRADPVNYYGYTKLLGEQFCRGCIARTCVTYGSGPASGKVNFALWLINSLKSGQNIRVVRDQFIPPTLNTSLARMVLEIADRRLCGVYHLTGATRISRYDFALELAREFDLDPSLILPSRMKDLNWTAKRPMDSSLDTSRARAELVEKPLAINEALKILREEVSCDLDL